MHNITVIIFIKINRSLRTLFMVEKLQKCVKISCFSLRLQLEMRCYTFNETEIHMVL